MKILSTCAMLLLFFISAQAAPITVTNNSSAGWVQISFNTFGLPANLTGIGCGSENGTICEPEGVFDFSVPFQSAGILNMFDDDLTTLSDQIHFFNDPNTGLGVVTVLSDPNLANILPGGTTLCTEGFSSGCVAAFPVTAADGTVITLTPASDGELAFDPFGLGADSSDEFQVTNGASVVPEPASLVLLGTGLWALGWQLRRKKLLG